MTLRALNRTTAKEAAYSSTQFGAINYLPVAPKDKDKNKGNADKDKDKENKGKA